MTIMKSIDMLSKAKAMFDAYNEQGPTPWKTFDGRDVPRWEQLNDAVRAKWLAAAQKSDALEGFHDVELDDVTQFMDKFGQLPLKTIEPGVVAYHREPRHLTVRKLEERHRFLTEELDEMKKAIDKARAGEGYDLPELADALVDLVYVAKGTAILLGLPWERLWDDVQRANMAKVRGVGKRGNKVDCVKPEGWVPPKTLEILEDAGYNPKNPGAEWDDPENR